MQSSYASLVVAPFVSFPFLFDFNFHLEISFRPGVLVERAISDEADLSSALGVS